MKVIGLYFVFLLFCVCQKECEGQESIPLNQCEVIPQTMYECEDEDPLFDFSGALRNINDDGDKVLDFKVVISETVLGDNPMLLKIEGWKNGAWDDELYNKIKKISEYLEEFAPRVWEKMREQMKPALTGEEKYEWPAESYEMKNFEISPSDLNIPVSAHGRFRVLVKIFNKEKELLFCHVIEFEVNGK